MTLKDILRSGLYLSYVVGLFVIIEVLEYLKSFKGKSYAYKSRQ
jgi:hypothetical protein